jgi:hypothetical protein
MAFVVFADHMLHSESRRDKTCFLSHNLKFYWLKTSNLRKNRVFLINLSACADLVLSASLLQSRIAVIKIKKCKFENCTNQYKSE